MTAARRMARELLASRPERAAFGLLLRRLLEVSVEIDRAVSQVDLPLVTSAYDPSHTRRLRGSLRDEQVVSPIVDEGSEAVQSLRVRIRSLASEEPVLLVAHLYSRATRDPLGSGAIGTLARAFLYPHEDVSPPVLDRFDEFFHAVESLPLATPVRRRLYDEGIRAQALNLRLARELFNQFMVV